MTNTHGLLDLTSELEKVRPQGSTENQILLTFSDEMKHQH
jgi:hypothetical protein